MKKQMQKSSLLQIKGWCGVWKHAGQNVNLQQDLSLSLCVCVCVCVCLFLADFPPDSVK